MKNLMFVLVFYSLSVGASTHPQQVDKEKEREKIKLRALADNLILTSRGLTSRQEQRDIDFAEEYAPLAEFVNQKLKD